LKACAFFLRHADEDHAFRLIKLLAVRVGDIVLALAILARSWDLAK